jgi:hypothetical protein
MSIEHFNIHIYIYKPMNSSHGPYDPDCPNHPKCNIIIIIWYSHWIFIWACLKMGYTIEIAIGEYDDQPSTFGEPYLQTNPFTKRFTNPYGHWKPQRTALPWMPALVMLCTGSREVNETRTIPGHWAPSQTCYQNRLWNLESGILEWWLVGVTIPK